MAQSGYQLYLQSAGWQKLRAEALKNAGKRCQVCNGKDKLEVHHRKYPKKLGTEPVTDLVVLCEDCHGMFHAHKRIGGKVKADIARPEPSKKVTQRAKVENQRKINRVLREYSSSLGRKLTREEIRSYTDILNK